MPAPSKLGASYRPKKLIANPNRTELFGQKEALDLYNQVRTNPRLFLENILGIKLWEKQQEIFDAIFSDDINRVTVKSCHASGKTFVAAACVLTFVHFYSPCVVITTAPTDRQVRAVLWKEIHSLYNRAKRPLGGWLLQTSYSLFEDTFAIGMTTDEANRFQGFHSDHVLIVVDEATGVIEEVFEAIEGVMAGGNAKLLLIGNPSSLEGTFYRSFHDPSYSKLFKHFTISAFDTPNVRLGREVIPGLVTRRWVEERKLIWGEEHPLYHIKVLGQFPRREFGDLVITPNLIERARNIELPVKPDEPVILGIDIGEFGGDETCIAVRHGPKLKKVYAYLNKSLPQIIEEILRIRAQWKATEIRIDSIGVGRGVYEFLKKYEQEQNEWRVIGIDVRTKPTQTAKYYGCRDEMWWEFRERLKQDQIDLSEFKDYDADITLAQFTMPKFSITPNTGLIRVETKPEMRRRNIPSTDRADAVLHAFYDSYKRPISRIFSAPGQLMGLEKTPVIELEDEWGIRPWEL